MQKRLVSAKKKKYYNKNKNNRTHYRGRRLFHCFRFYINFIDNNALHWHSPQQKSWTKSKRLSDTCHYGALVKTQKVRREKSNNSKEKVYQNAIHIKVARSSIFVSAPSTFGPFITYWQLNLYCKLYYNTWITHYHDISFCFLQSKLISRDNDELTMTSSPVGLVSLMDRALCLVIANVRIWFPVKPEFFQVLCQPPRLFSQLRGSCSLSYLYPQLSNIHFTYFNLMT